MIAIYTLTSTLHDEAAVSRATREFLESLDLDYTLKGNDYADYGTHALSLIYVRTGGTESIFKSLLPQLQQQSGQPFYLLTSGKSNSLAASMEILSYLHQHNIEGEIIHGSPEYISKRVNALERTGDARKQLYGCRLGIIGAPSDWLISSNTDKNVVKEKLGIDLIDIPMQELLKNIESPNSLTPDPSPKGEGSIMFSNRKVTTPLSFWRGVGSEAAGALRIYDALKIIVNSYRLQGFTLRCFDLLTAVHNTGCLALAKLNSEGIVASCEGDVPAMLTMKIAQALTGIIGFQANPASINPETGEMVFAHCTIPFSLVEHYELDTHFESGIGVGIRGYMKEGPVTIFKVSADLTRSFIAEGNLIRNEAKPDLCRTQQVIRLDDPSQTSYFLTHPIGNHHIILPGRHKALLSMAMEK